MKFSILLTFVTLGASIAEASLHARKPAHADIAKRYSAPKAERKSPKCAAKPSYHKSEPKPKAEPKKPKAEPKPKSEPQPKSKPAPKHNDSKPSGSHKTPYSGGGSGIINVEDDQCGANGATPDTTATTGPNGKLDWLNCGVNSGGWNPPNLGVDDIITVDLQDAIDQGGPFKACSPYVWAFEQYGQQYGLPPIILASFALQESSCNPNTVGGAGEQGLMQLTKDKCGGAPGGNCKDVGYNVSNGAKYFSNLLADNGGNLVKSIGMYNGWSQGMTYGKATAAAHTGCCRCQNNLDYLHQFLNGWVLNIDAYSHHLGKYFNLDQCGNGGGY